jgi:hypothetical protein
MINFRRLTALLAIPRGDARHALVQTARWFKEHTTIDPSVDSFGNFTHIVEGEGAEDTLFTAHYDTVDNPTHIHEKDMVWFRSTKTLALDTESSKHRCLGADDGAGCEVLVRMIEMGIPGTYVWFANEEKGCRGSKGFLELHGAGSVLKFKRVISFDRAGTSSIITHQSWGRCCSELFAKELGAQLDLVPDDGGVYTDSATFMEVVPECTNISVGGNHSHNPSETLDVGYLGELVDKLATVNWSGLPTKRDPQEVEDMYDNWFAPDEGMLRQAIVTHPDLAMQYLIQDTDLAWDFLDEVSEREATGGHDRYDEYTGNFEEVDLW